MRELFAFFFALFCKQKQEQTGGNDRDKLVSSRKYWRAKYAAERRKRVALAKRLKQSEKEAENLVNTIFRLTDIKWESD